MREYKVIIAPDAKEQMKRYLAYILFVLRNEQAYEAVKQDYYNTLKRLATTASIIRKPDEPELLERNLKKICFEKHNYVMLFRITDSDEPVAEVAKIFHTLEDYVKKL